MILVTPKDDCVDRKLGENKIFFTSWDEETSYARRAIYHEGHCKHKPNKYIRIICNSLKLYDQM